MTPRRHMMKTAIIGAGYVSRYHARALRTLDFVEIVGVCDADGARADRLASELKCRAVRDVDELAPLRPDVAHVLTPPASHCELTLRALRMGCHVFVEKPMAQSAAECDRMIAAASDSGRHLSVNHSARLDPAVLRALAVVRAGACGDVLSVDFLRSSEYPDYAGGPLPACYADPSYPLHDLGVHGLSILETFLGQTTDLDLQCWSTGRNPRLAIDEWHAIVRCEKGMGRMYLSWNVKPMQNELVVHGTHGVVHVDCFLQTCTVRRSSGVPKQIEKPLQALGSSVSTIGAVLVNTARLAAGRLRPSPGIHNSVRRFYFALRDNTPVPVPAEEGRRLVAWMERVSRRPLIETQRTRRRVPLPPARVLVTGASGFLGRALIARLVRDGESPRVLLRRPAPHIEAIPQVSVAYGDLGNPPDVLAAVRGVDVVYHAGAALHGRPAEFECATVWGTKNIIAACLQHQIGRLVHVSSLSVLQRAGLLADALVDESSPMEPHPERRGPYTSSKLRAELLVRDAMRSDGLRAAIVRPGMIFGPAATPATPSGAFAFRGNWVVMGSGSLCLPLVYVDDVVEALLLAGSEPGAVGQTIHILDHHPVTQKEYIELCRQCYPDTPRARFVPGAVLIAAAAATAPLALIGRRPVSVYQVRSLPPMTRFNSIAATEVLHWSPVVGTVEGLRRTFATAGPDGHDVALGAAQREMAFLAARGRRL